MSALLNVQDAVVEFHTSGGIIRALDGVSIQVEPGETLAVVGESGCGKTTLARAILGLQPLKSGRIEMNSRTITGTYKEIAQDIGMVWQDPYASLDPRWRAGRSILEAATISGKKMSAPALFEEVGLDTALVDRFPHQLSGGQRQRVAIGRALALKPPLVICDEPTAALDLSIRAQILNLLKQIQANMQCSFLYISHDLMTVRFLADRVAVMYMGRVVETGLTEDLFQNPRHPYTKALLDSAPTLDKLQSLPDAIEGEIPDPRTRFVGCRFASRCPNAQAFCLDNDPGPTAEGSRIYFCHFPEGSTKS